MHTWDEVRNEEEDDAGHVVEAGHEEVGDALRDGEGWLTHQGVEQGRGASYTGSSTHIRQVQQSCKWKTNMIEYFRWYW